MAGLPPNPMRAWHATVAIAAKDLRLLVRDRANAFFTFGFPVLLAMFFGFVFGGAGDDNAEMDVAIAKSPAVGAASAGPGGADAFIAALDADPAIAVHVVPDHAQGSQLVRKGRAVACLVIPDDFEPRRAIMSGGITFAGDFDPRRTAEVGLLSGKLTQLAFNGIVTSVNDPKELSEMIAQGRSTMQRSDLPATQKLLFEGVFRSLDSLAADRAKSPAGPPSPSSRTREPAMNSPPVLAPAPTTDRTPPPSDTPAWQPVRLELIPLRAEGRKAPRPFELSFPQGVVWGLMGCVTAFAASLAEERSRGTLKRLTVAPLTPGRVLSGKALACFMASIAVQIVLLIVGLLPPFRVQLGSPMLLLPVLILNGVAFTGVMMALAGMAKSVGGSLGMSRAAVLVLAMIGGGTIPIFFMPRIMQYISHISPFKWATLAIEGVLWRQYSVVELLPIAGVLLLFGVVGGIVGVLAMRRWAST
jgi:ABC-2 type transport system permease protein